MPIGFKGEKEFLTHIVRGAAFQRLPAELKVPLNLKFDRNRFVIPSLTVYLDEVKHQRAWPVIFGQPETADTDRGRLFRNQYLFTN